MFLFFPPKLRHLVLAKGHETHPGKNATEALVRMIAYWPGIAQQFVSKGKDCQMNRPSLGKTASKWPEADVGNSSTWTGVMLRTKAIS